MNKKIKQLLQQNKTFVLCTHTDPDGDAIGSCIAMGEIIAALNPQATLIRLNDPVFKTPLHDLLKKYNFTNILPHLPNNAIIIALDASNPERIYTHNHPLKIDLNIDHHIDNKLYGDIALVDGNAASTGMVLFKLLHELNIELTPAMAEGIYLSISSDTGNFAFSNTSSEVFTAAQETTAKGAHPYATYQLLNENMSLSELQELGSALNTAEHICNGHVIIGYMDKTSTLDNRFLIDFLRRDKAARLAIVLVEKDDHIKISIRSKDDTNVCTIAKHFNGGGHMRAAAGKIFVKTMAEAKQHVINYLTANGF